MTNLEREAFVRQIKSAFTDDYQRGVLFRIINEIQTLENQLATSQHLLEACKAAYSVAKHFSDVDGQTLSEQLKCAIVESEKSTQSTTGATL